MDEVSTEFTTLLGGLVICEKTIETWYARGPRTGAGAGSDVGIGKLVRRGPGTGPLIGIAEAEEACRRTPGVNKAVIMGTGSFVEIYATARRGGITSDQARSLMSSFLDSLATIRHDRISLS